MTTSAHAFWTLGDYARIAELIAAMGPDLVRAAGVGPGQRVLDVGAGTGNATLPAAAAGAQVVGTDIAPELMAVGERAAKERRLDIAWQVADAQALPFPDASFDVVLSTAGAMFASDHEATARELLRVCRPGGTIAMANWTPGGEAGRLFASGEAGRLFEILARFAPPPPGPSPTAWGEPEYVTHLLAPAAVTTTTSHVRLAFDGESAEVVAYYRAHFPPVITTFAALDDVQAAALEAELIDLFEGGYDLEYLTVLALTPATGARPAASPARPG
jgi:SAM-dependent methyltransferase